MGKFGRIVVGALATAAITAASAAGDNDLAIAATRATLTCVSKTAAGGATPTDDRRVENATVLGVGQRAG